MNYDLLKKKMDKFFREVSADQLIQDLKELGYPVYNPRHYEDCIQESSPVNIKVNELLNVPGASYKQEGDCSYAMAA
jgi:hypothetical protein